MLAAAVLIDLAFGDPPNRWHPVVALGRALGWRRRVLAHGGPARLMLSGDLLTLVVAGLAAAAGLGVTCIAGDTGVAGILLEAVALKLALSLRGLGRAATSVADELGRGELARARVTVGVHLVSRPTATLGAGHVVSAAIESVAENLTDSFVAPLLFYAALGLPGAALYRAVNTADAMLGYREGVLEHFGKVAARLDDALNVIPARRAAAALVVATGLTRASRVSRAVRVMWRDHGRTASPNAGWTMAALAGALGVALEKAGAYRLGDGPLPPATDIAPSLAVVRAALGPRSGC